MSPRLCVRWSKLPFVVLLTAVSLLLLALFLGLPAIANPSPPEPARGVGSGTGAIEGPVPEARWSDAEPIQLSIALDLDLWTTLLSENFESTSWPTTGWTVFDNDGATNGEYYWANRCPGHNSARSAWAIGGGGNGQSLSCGATYPNNLNSWMAYGPVDLGQATAVELSFHFWLNSECDGANCATKSDRLWVTASTNGTDFYGWWWAGNSSQDSSADANGWVARTLDMTTVSGVGSLAGQPQVWFAFIFQSDGSVGYPKGALVDNVVLRAQAASGTGRAFLPLTARRMGSDTAIVPVTSSQEQVISTSSGVQIHVPEGAVPRRPDGSDGTVTFSVETNVQPPAPLPAGLTVESSVGVVKFGPDGYTFAEPVKIAIPVNFLGNWESLALLRYQPSEDAWIRYPWMGAPQGGDAVGAAVFDLGYAVVVADPPAQASSASAASCQDAVSLAGCTRPCHSTSSAAMYFTGNRCPVDSHMPGNCWYTYRVIDVTLSNPNDAPLWWGSRRIADHLINRGCNPAWINEPWRCWSFTQGNVLGVSEPAHYYNCCSASAKCTFGVFPRGRYELCVEVQRPARPGDGLPNAPPRRAAYSLPVIVDLTDGAYRFPPGSGSSNAWWNCVTPIPAVPAGGTWVPGGTCLKPAWTTPMGTGDFQATLTWVNTAERTTDLDLHLKGPDGIHIYYSRRRQGNLELDRDWRHMLGNAVENIYNTGPMPVGDYTLSVVLYSGSPTSYQVRVVRGGTVNTYNRTISGPREEQIIQQFTVR